MIYELILRCQLIPRKHTHTRAQLNTTFKVSIIRDVGDLSLAFCVSGNLISTLVMTIRRLHCVSEKVQQFVLFDTCFSSLVSCQVCFSCLRFSAFLFMTFTSFSSALHSPVWKTQLLCPDSVFLFSWWMRYSGWSKSFFLIVVEENRKKLQDMEQISLWDICCGLPEQLFILFSFCFVLLMVISSTPNTLKLVQAKDLPSAIKRPFEAKQRSINCDIKPQGSVFVSVW